jgi:cytochrome c oxidase subunit IV
MNKILFILITVIFVIVSVFFREQTGIRTTSIVVLSLVLSGVFVNLFLKK